MPLHNAKADTHWSAVSVHLSIDFPGFLNLPNETASYLLSKRKTFDVKSRLGLRGCGEIVKAG